MKTRGRTIRFKQNGIVFNGIVQEQIRDGLYSVDIEDSESTKPGELPVRKIMLVRESEIEEGVGVVNG